MTSTGSRALDFALGIGEFAPALPKIPDVLLRSRSESQPSEQPHGMGSPFDPIIEQAASKYGLPSNLLRAVIGAESSGNPNAVSNKGATGLMQLMPATAARYGVKELTDPHQNIMGGAHYLSDLMRMFNNNVTLAVAGYNAGEGNVIKSGYKIPNIAETQAYVPKVLSMLQQYNQQGLAPQQQPMQASGAPVQYAGRFNKDVNPALHDILARAARETPFKVTFNSGYRPGDKRQHGQHNAIDVQLTDPVTGKALKNYQSPETALQYQQFANKAREIQQRLYPELSEQFRWGGYFGGKKYGSLDLMHFDLGGTPGRGMLGGSWEQGFNPQQIETWGLKGAGVETPAPAPTSPGPRMAPPPAGYKAMWLSNGTQLNVPEKMNEKQVADMLAEHEDEKFRGAVPTRAFPLQGKTYMVPYNYGDKDAEHALVKAGAIEGPGVLNSLWQHSVSGLERTLGRTAKFLGDEKTAKEANRLAEQGDWTTSDVEVEAAKKQGLLPGFGAMARQHLAEPLADIAGQVGPSLGLGALAAPFVGPLVGGGLAAATQWPSSVESIKEYGEATGHPVSDTAAKIAGVPYAALTTMGLPLRGAGRALGLHGAESAITDLAARGAVEEAQRLVGSGVWNRAKDVAKAYTGNVGANTALFEALEVIPRVASGQSPVDPNFETHKKILEQAAWFGAPHALEAGMFGQGRRQSALDRALEHTEARRAQTQAQPAGAVEDGFEQATGLPPSARAQREMAEERPVQSEATSGIEIGKPIPIEAQVVNDLVEAMRENPDLDQAEFIKAKTAEYQAKQQVSEDGLPIHPVPNVKQEVKPDEATVVQEAKPEPKQVLQEYKSLLDTHTPENHEQIVAKHREVVKAYEDVGKTVPKTYSAEPTKPAAPAKPLGPSTLPPQSLMGARVAFAQARDAYKADPTNESLYEAAKEAQKVNREEQIAYKGEESLPPELSIDLPKPEPKEVPSAVEESKASLPDGSSSAQPEFRKESRDQTVPSERVEPKGQRDEAVKPSHEEPKEVKSKDLETRLKEAVKRKDEEFTIPEEEVNKFSERDKISYYQFQGETLAEIGHHLNATKQQVSDKIKEHGLPDTSKTVIKTSDARRRYVRALEETREKRSKEIQAWKEFYEEMTGEEAPPDVYKEKKIRSLIEQAVRQKLDEGESPRSIAKHFGMPYEAFKAMMRKKYGMVLPAKGKPSTQPHTVESLQKALADTYGSRKPVVDIKSRTEANVDAGTKAFYDTKSKRVTLVHDNLDIGDDIHGLLKHEIGVHARRLGMKDAEFQGILRHLDSMRAKGIKAVEEAYKHVPKDTPEHLRNEEALGYLVQHHENLPIARRFMSWLRRLAHKVTGHAGWLKAEDLSEIADKVLKRDIDVESRPDRNISGRLESYVGEKAKNIKLKHLNKAKRRILEGEDPEKVRKETGWFKAKWDNKWRFEIPDNNIKFKGGWDSINTGFNTVRLEDVLDAPKLFKAYPELRDVQFTKSMPVLWIMKGVTGYWEHAKNKLAISPGVTHAKEALGIIAHEIQHFIQTKESFTNGGAEDSIRLNDLNALKKLRHYIENYFSGWEKDNKLEAIDELLSSASKHKFDKLYRNLDEIKAQISNKEKELIFEKEEHNRLQELRNKLETEANEQYKNDVKNYNIEYDKSKRERTENTEKQLKAISSGDYKLLDKLRAEYNNIKSPTYPKNPVYTKGTEIYKKLHDLYEQQQSAYDKSKFLRDEIKALEPELNERVKELKTESKEAIDANIPYDLYKLIAGEREARDTAHRLDLSKAERKELKPNATEGIPDEYVLDSPVDATDARMFSKKHDPIIDEIDKAGLTTREEPKNFEETHKEAIEWAKGIKSGFRSEFVDFVEPIAKRVKDLPTMYGPKGMEKLRADMVSYEAENAAGFVGSALQIGAPVINKSRAMMLKRSEANLKSIAKYVLKHHKDGDKLFGYQLKYETLKDLWAMAENDAKDITRLRQEIKEAQVKIKHFKQMGKNDTRLRPFEDAAIKELKDKQNALTAKLKTTKVDSETLKPNLPELTAERTALYEKIKEEHPWMQKALDDTRSMLHGLVDFMEMSGMIDKAKAQNWKSWNYAPLYKALEYLEEEPLFAAGQRNGSTPETLRMIKELKGNMFKSNMLENLHKHHYVTMIPAIINNARHAAIEDMITLDALYKQKETPGLSFDEAMQKATRGMEVHGRSTNTVKVMIKGEERHFKIDDADLLSTLAFSRTAHGGIARLLGPIAALQRGVHLKQPAFWVKQIALEPVYANFMTGLKTLVHPGQAIVNLWKIATGKNVNAKILEQHGIDTGWHDSAGEKSFSFSRLQEPTPYHELIGKQSKLGKARKKLDDIHNSIDESIRTAVYEAALKDGKELGYSGQTLEDFAVTKARNYINFANRGKNQFFNEFRAVTAFSSAAINSLNAIYKNATGHNLNAKEAARVRKIFWTRVAATIPMVVGYELMAQSMGAKNEQDDINKYTTIKLSDSIQIPFAWDIGTFIVGIPRVLTDVMLLNAADANKLTAEQGLKRIAEMVWSNVLPPMAPTAIKAAVEPMANFDFRSWNPIEGAGAQRRLPEYRGKSSSEIGNMMGEVFGWSPKRIDHFNKAMLGWTYDFANKAVEVMEEGYVDKPMEPSKKWKYTGLGQFMPQEMPGVDIIFDAQAKAEQANNSLRDAMKENKPDVVNRIKNDPELKVYRTHAPMFKNMTTVLNNFEVRIARINNRKDITPAARAELMAEERKKKQEYAEKSRQQVIKILGEFAP